MGRDCARATPSSTLPLGVALTRAIVNRPKVLLLDEPLAALDYNLRKRMQLELKRLQERLGMTFVIVTHDQEEALSMADRIVVMSDGAVEQVGPGEAIYADPKTRLLPTSLARPISSIASSNRTGRCGPAATAPGSPTRWPPGSATAATLMVRPERISVVASEDPRGRMCIPAVVRDVVYAGATARIYASCGLADEVVVAHDGQPPGISQGAAAAPFLAPRGCVGAGSLGSHRTDAPCKVTYGY
jgi:spermidine/putrescine transport system ATP-binding protein